MFTTIHYDTVAPELKACRSLFQRQPAVMDTVWGWQSHERCWAVKDRRHALRVNYRCDVSVINWDGALPGGLSVRGSVTSEPHCSPAGRGDGRRSLQSWNRSTSARRERSPLILSSVGFVSNCIIEQFHNGARGWTWQALILLLLRVWNRFNTFLLPWSSDGFLGVLTPCPVQKFEWETHQTSWRVLKVQLASNLGLCRRSGRSFWSITVS